MSDTVGITCLCGDIKESLELESKIPIKNITCSCNICRYCTGALYLSTLPLKGQPAFTHRLCEYRSSDRVSRFFCGQCGSHVLILGTEDGSWSVCSGLVERVVGLDAPVPRLERHTQHEFIGDTIDGGLMVCLAEEEGKQIPFFMQGPDEQPVSVEHGKQPSPLVGLRSNTEARDGATLDSTPATEKLAASCHCGGVQFSITRPNKESSTCSSPWPDLIVPYHSKSSENPNDVKWWLRADGQKYLAGTCTCRSCRLASGVPIQTWAFIPKANIQKIDGSKLDFTIGKLKQYDSSKGCHRQFCQSCGATVFWHCDERPELIDVSVGILRAPEGSRAERWLEWWTERLSFAEKALDLYLASTMEAGLRFLGPA